MEGLGRKGERTRQYQLQEDANRAEHCRAGKNEVGPGRIIMVMTYLQTSILTNTTKYHIFARVLKADNFLHLSCFLSDSSFPRCFQS